MMFFNLEITPNQSHCDTKAPLLRAMDTNRQGKTVTHAVLNQNIAKFYGTWIMKKCPTHQNGIETVW